ncbi:immunoglobulin-like domain-containing protein [Maribacter luteus]|uniref:immunoglobulin-like domain-containing protein n=1 Tax=Maribacter luteus TaxID=2594478 RepID=UPI00248F4BAA|nr:immunoglobulin-like domain-containing protein [Maribacter luteus]
MNKKRRSPIYFILMLIILIACTKQVGLVTEVEFDLSENYTSEGYVNEPLATTLTVVPEELIEGYIYDYRYTVLNGEGHFEDANGEEVPQGERRPFDPLSKSLDYIGSTVGTHKVRIQATDTYGFTEELELTYILSEVPVTWTATIADSELLFGDQTTITVTLGNEGLGNATYERNYQIETGSGALTQSDGTGVGLDGYEAITPGTYQYGFVPDALGAVTLTFDLRDSNGQELTASVNLEVVEELSSGENDIIAFTLPEQNGTSLIDDQAHTVSVTVPMGTTLTTAPTVLTVSEGATVTPDMGTQQDFTSPVIYTVTAENGDGQEWTVTVIEEATSADPEITLIGGDITLTVGDTYVEEGATATDAEDGDISGDIVIDASAVDTNTAGSYQVTYNVTDSDGNAATEVIRTVTVNAVANEPPTATDFSVSVVTNSTDNSIDVNDHIADAENDPLTVNLQTGSPANGAATVSGTVISYTPNNGYTGNDVITYLVDDGNNPVVNATITVTVSDNASPEITLIGGDMTMTVGDTYIEEGATATDAEDGDISGDIVIDASAVDTATSGSYQVTYNVTDSDGNAATEVIRTVNVSAAPDTTPPVITLVGGTVNLTVGDIYVEPGYSATDNVDGNITGSVVVGGIVNTGVADTYTVTYNVSDSAGNPAVQKTRSVVVSAAPDTTPPVITLVGGTVNLTVGVTYVEPGYSATDNEDGNITGSVVVAGLPNTSVADTYTVTYNVSDSAGNPAVQKTRSVVVSAAPDTTPPVITLVGGTVNLTVGESYIDPGYSATDNVDGNITGSVVVAGLPNTSIADTYTVTYNVSDAAGNMALQKTRSVVVSSAPDTTLPVITLVGGTVNLTVGDTYVEPGYSATDNVDGNITGSVVVAGLPNTSVTDTYTVTYNVSDAAGNAAVQKTRSVVVSAAPDTTPPVITLVGGTVNLTVGDTYIEPGYSATDNVDGNITGSVVVGGIVNTGVADTYTVTYNVSDVAGNMAIQKTRDVVVSAVNQPPVADGVATPLSGSAPLTVSFKNINSTDEDGTIEGVFYDFGDGSTENATYPSEVSHVYDTPGTYMARMTVTDDDSATDYMEFEIEVSAPLPSASFDNGTSLSSSLRTISGELTVSNGPIQFELSLFAGNDLYEPAEYHLTIGSDSWYVQAAAGTTETERTSFIPTGTYSYTVQLIIPGGSAQGYVITIIPD